ncbi:dTDP-4-amino-4,6-dideoxygalactose transaminase [Mesoterricola sediminis]|uniref:dTDP-4-amino-4,6-dideoxygalactose transaminase n=2 Tax=Mesoterricola sediminis TaxID=2927980 RepID=A0AA48H308_9BACT|nr:dTDP-4-amino-4,6-dideoxygalactose transaminase [Mesoterricola sediminis]
MPMSASPIPFNRPVPAGREAEHLQACLASGRWCGDGPWTRKAQTMLEASQGFRKALLTPSCTAALEMAALLSGVGPGDEVILPSYTFVSTANAFALRGARLVFADSLATHPNLDAAAVEALVTPRTRVIVAMHYGGTACDMDALERLAERHGLLLVEDAAQCIGARHQGRPLGSIGAFGTFSFHETKNVACGEGGALVVNDPRFDLKAEIVREKGTNRAAFFRGEVDKYGWVDLGSSYLPSEFAAAVLVAQLEELDRINTRRIALWERYREALAPLARAGRIALPELPEGHGHNGHVFYVVTPDLATRTRLMAHLKADGISAVFHYQSLHKSPYFQDHHDGRPLPNSDRFSDCLLRLPLFASLTDEEVDRVVASVTAHLS